MTGSNSGSGETAAGPLEPRTLGRFSFSLSVSMQH
jgi:hypothetical protein